MLNPKRELPAWMESGLSERDAQLNKLPVGDLQKLFYDKQINIFVDRGLAIQAASSGVPTSGLTLLISLMFPALILGAPIIWYFYSWVQGLIVLVLAVLAFRSSRALTVAKVRDQALSPDYSSRP